MEKYSFFTSYLTCLIFIHTIADHLKQKPGNEAAVPGSRGNTPFSMGSLTGMAPNPVVPSLPSQPRIEPRVQALR